MPGAARRKTMSQSRILAATSAILATGEHYADIPVERILEAADVSRSTFYQWFPDKTALILQLTTPLLEEFVAAADRYWKHPSQAQPETLTDVIAELFGSARRYRVIWRAYLETTSTDARFGDSFRRGLQNYMADIADRIRTEQAAGLVSADIKPDQTARFIVVGMQAGFSDIMQLDDDTDDRAFAAAMARSIWLTMYGGR
ncbi:TetR/AcrR family transcriptional regulator [Gordonia otitidis]|nr:TetR/AcrR family transcriptional regulator [Gordonia otitidis]UEA58295.1 TetR/AcrR family transcriptional regulator [Gordonia otitidis]